MYRHWQSFALAGILATADAGAARAYPGADLGPVLNVTHQYIGTTDPNNSLLNGSYTSFLVEIRSSNGMLRYYPTITSFQGIQNAAGILSQLGTFTLVDSPIYFKSIIIPQGFATLTGAVEGQPGDLYDWNKAGDARDVTIQLYNGTPVAPGIFLDSAIVLHNCRPVRWGVNLQSTPGEYVSPIASNALGWPALYPFYSFGLDNNAMANYLDSFAESNNQYTLQDHLDLTYFGITIL